MRTIHVMSTVAVSALFLASAPAWAAADYYLEIDEIEGEAAADSHKETIEVMSFSWGASNPGAMTGSSGARKPGTSAAPASPARESAAGVTTGKQAAAAAPGAEDAVSELIVLARESPSKASTGLSKMCAAGKQIKSGVLTGQGKRYELKDVIVTSCTVKGDQKVITLKGHVTLIK